MRKKLIILAIVVAVAAAVLGALATFWTEYEWFKQLEFGSVYITVLMAKVGTGVAFGLVALVMLGVHIHFIRMFSKPRTDWTLTTPEGDLDLKELVSKVSTPVVIAAALLVATAMGYWAATNWESVLRWMNQTPFGEREPILNKDIGFYLFELPLLQFAQTWLIYLTGACAAGVAAVYLSRGAIETKGRWPEMSPEVRAHLLVALAVVALVIGWGFRLEMYETLFSKRGVAYGATYTDVWANLIAYRVIIAVSILCALYLVFMVRFKTRGTAAVIYPLFGLGALVAVYLLGVFVYPYVVQRFVVDPNELEKERPFLEHAIAGTRKAYQLDNIEVRQYPATDDLDADDIKANRPTIDNVKIWDHRPLRETYRQLQVIRLYYDFPNISVDRYRIGDNYWQVMLSARELIHTQLPQQSQTWINRHLQYTHGYGVCLSPVNKSKREGLPDLWIKNIPPVARNADLAVKRPEIYYGLESNDFVLVKTNTQEFDFPRGDENVYTTYQGEGGVGIGSFFRQLLFAIRFADVNLLFTEHLTEESRILFNRAIQQRVATLAPFLMLDQEPYITVADGRLYWIQDAYTISYRYPYSQPTSLGRRRRINYIRNSVKVVVDAFDGRVRFYVWDNDDPLVATYRKMFPDLFRETQDMPAALRSHVRYPKDLFTLQATMYESFHMTDPRVFYNQEDKWNIAGELAGKTSDRKEVQRQPPGVTAQKVTSQNRMTPYYMIMRLPEERQEEFLLMVPFTPTNKDNMVAWMTARCDGDNYGKLLVYAFPKQKLIFGPMQIEARIDQDDHISQWITLRNQQGSTVLRGDLLVIPIEESILYVEPIYLQSTQTQLPELKQVIVAFEERLAMRPTLVEALDAVFGPGDAPTVKKGDRPGRGPVADAMSADVATARGLQSALPADIVQVVREAKQHYEEAQKSLGSADWATYGKRQSQLRQKLEKLAKMLEPAMQPRVAEGQEAPASQEQGKQPKTSQAPGEKPKASQRQGGQNKAKGASDVTPPKAAKPVETGEAAPVSPPQTHPTRPAAPPAP